MIEGLLKKIDKYQGLDAIVVEGYDGVGKGMILNAISKHYGIVPYRPDYNLWQMFDHRKSDRWKVSGFFWDIYSHFGWHCERPMLFDRGVISGAVYNNDMNIAMHYKEMLRDMNVLHILVSCSPDDYMKFYKARHKNYVLNDMLDECEKFIEYNNRYLEALELAEVECLVYINEYDDTIDDTICQSCGHYSYGMCRHPLKNCPVDAKQERCQLSEDKEVQDVDSKVYSMQS